MTKGEEEWARYLKVPLGPEMYRALHLADRRNFAAQREILRTLHKRLMPASVAVLGAGLLSDVPYKDIVATTSVVHLVDWSPDTLNFGLKFSVISRDENGEPSCIYCDLPEDEAQAYCAHYQLRGKRRENVCDNFSGGPGQPPTCATFERGTQPQLHFGDVTQGFAKGFAEAAAHTLENSRSPRDAMSRGLQLARDITKTRKTTSIENHSVELVTSSLTASLFPAEPFTYFAAKAHEKFGPPTAKEDIKLQKSRNQLRDVLFREQFDRLCDEIERITKPGGHCILALEIFKKRTADDEWKMVPEMAQAIESLCARFRLDFDSLPPDQMMAHATRQNGISLIQNFVIQL